MLSRTEHVRFCLKMGGPPSKPKYYLVLDSGLVPWGKGEKNPEQGSEIDLKPNAYNLLEHIFMKINIMWQRPFCIMSQRVRVTCKLKPVGVGTGKPSVNSALSM